ncbi:hypothetical protein F5Y17DRAFT_458568 [Xylariaceae sp. FL0594]|nr:hypothetical protein F5Y17DRAFT_458568 [Xylariaceae sp. FL0594]
MPSQRQRNRREQTRTNADDENERERQERRQRRIQATITTTETFRTETITTETITATAIETIVETTTVKTTTVKTTTVKTTTIKTTTTKTISLWAWVAREHKEPHYASPDRSTHFQSTKSISFLNSGTGPGVEAARDDLVQWDGVSLRRDRSWMLAGRLRRRSSGYVDVQLPTNYKLSFNRVYSSRRPRERVPEGGRRVWPWQGRRGSTSRDMSSLAYSLPSRDTRVDKDSTNETS